MRNKEAKNWPVCSEEEPKPGKAVWKFSRSIKRTGKKLMHLLTLLNRNTAETMCANLQEQIQKPKESVFQTLKRFMASKPDEIRQSRIRTSAGKCGPAPRRPLGPTFKLVFTTGLCSDIRR
jgi:hypothetical protein